MKFLVIFAIALGFSNAWAKGDASRGKAKSTTCAACHGVNGVSANELWPNLAGQKAAYLVKQIKAFKTGVRKDPLMNTQVAHLSDQDIEDLAAFYSSLK